MDPGCTAVRAVGAVLLYKGFQVGENEGRQELHEPRGDGVWVRPPHYGGGYGEVVRARVEAVIHSYEERVPYLLSEVDEDEVIVVEACL